MGTAGAAAEVWGSTAEAGARVAARAVAQRTTLRSTLEEYGQDLMKNRKPA